MLKAQDLQGGNLGCARSGCLIAALLVPFPATIAVQFVVEADIQTLQELG